MKCIACVVVGLGCALSAQASERTGLAFVDADVGAEYSQAVGLELSFTDKNGLALDGTTACGGTCRVSVELRPSDGSGSVVQVTAPDVVVDAAGRARVRLTLVNGTHGGAEFLSDDAGFDYTLSARFRGAGAPLPDNDDVDCQEGAAGTVDGRLCPATATGALKVFPEVPALAFSQDVDMALADTVTLAATLSDSTGDADAAGEDIEGPGEKVLAGFPIRFFYDVDDDGRPSGDELLGEAITNDFGVAAFEFTADPAFAQAGVYDAGLHAEFPGDERYGTARTAVKLTLRARGPDATKTIIEVDPGTLPADGVSEALVRVRLVDADNNLLGPDAPEHEVAIVTSLGLLQESVERDVLDGTYSQVIRVQRKGGTAKIEVTLDGDDAGSAELVIEGREGCTCTSSTSSPTPLGLGLLALPILLRRRRA